MLISEQQSYCQKPDAEETGKKTIFKIRENGQKFDYTRPIV